MDRLIIAAVTIAFFAVIDPSGIAVMLSPMMILYVILTFALNGAKMCVTTANTSFMADIIDYELDRSCRYVPAVVTGVYSLIDKIVSAFSATIAAGAVALIGYTTTMPQPGDPCTSAVFWTAMALNYGMRSLDGSVRSSQCASVILTKKQWSRYRKGSRIRRPPFRKQNNKTKYCINQAV